MSLPMSPWASSSLFIRFSESHYPNWLFSFRTMFKGSRDQWIDDISFLQVEDILAKYLKGLATDKMKTFCLYRIEFSYFTRLRSNLWERALLFSEYLKILALLAPWANMSMWISYAPICIFQCAWFFKSIFIVGRIEAKNRGINKDIVSTIKQKFEPCALS